MNSLHWDDIVIYVDNESEFFELVKLLVKIVLCCNFSLNNVRSWILLILISASIIYVRSFFVVNMFFLCKTMFYMRGIDCSE